jgi:hypothetical protein
MPRWEVPIGKFWNVLNQVVTKSLLLTGNTP